MKPFTIIYMENVGRGQYPAMIQRIRHVEATNEESLRWQIDTVGIDPCCVVFCGHLLPAGGGVVQGWPSSEE